MNNEIDDKVDEAVEWQVRLSSDAATEADWLAFEQWLSQDARNQAAYDRVEKVWVELDAAKPHIAKQAPIADSNVITLMPRSAKERSIPGTLLAVAASISLAVVAASIYYFMSTSPQTYTTAIGEMRTIKLADGTSIRLNSGSTIKVALGRDHRQVEMGDAEASFDVSKEPKRPFIVTVDDRQVRVVGTDFNILHHAGRMIVTLRRGSIDVIAHNADVPASPIRLSPGQQLVHYNGRPDSTVHSVEPDIAYAWQAGRLIYDDSPLSDVVADLNRYFKVPIHAGIDTKALRFSGVLAIDSEDAVVQRIEMFLPVKADREDGEITLHLVEKHANPIQ